MPGLADVLMVAIPAALTGGVGVYGGRQSRKLELDKLRELHRQKVEDREHAERRDTEVARAAALNARTAAAQRVLQAADRLPPPRNVSSMADRQAWAEYNTAVAAVEMLHDSELSETARALGIGPGGNAYLVARHAFITAARPQTTDLAAVRGGC